MDLTTSGSSLMKLLSKAIKKPKIEHWLKKIANFRILLNWERMHRLHMKLISFMINFALCQGKIFRLPHLRLDYERLFLFK